MELGESPATLHAQPGVAVGDVEDAAQPALVHEATPSLDGGGSGSSKPIKKRKESADAKETAVEDLRAQRKRTLKKYDSSDREDDSEQALSTHGGANS